ncbi:hypothetical protein OS493_001221 [Desmophyllum pertusum]|uniref:Uncharacterized protein n=1 Tax=Desmophyllum pertusum TaxID=174260 RepID=A0A9W9ZU07_9CNID|nr:hypothetical protein OS493_001221 [Desmophyllum pertusum]
MQGFVAEFANPSAKNQKSKETEGIEGFTSLDTANAVQLKQNKMMIKVMVLATCLFLWRIPSEMRPPSWFWCKSLTLEEFLRTFSMATTPLVISMTQQTARPMLPTYCTIGLLWKKQITIEYIMASSHILTRFTFNFVKVINVLCFRGLQMAKERSTLKEASVAIEATKDPATSAMTTRKTESQGERRWLTA